MGRHRQLPHDGGRALHAAACADGRLSPVLLRRGLDPRRGHRPASLERRQHPRSLGGRHDGRRARAGDLDDHRASRRGYDAVRLERRLAGDRPPPFQLRCLPVQGGARLRRQGHLGRLGHRGQSRRPRGHEQPSPARHQRDARGRARPRDRARQQRARRRGLRPALHRALRHGRHRQGRRPVRRRRAGASTPAASRRCSSAPPAPGARRRATRSRTTRMAAPACTATTTA